MKIIKNENLKQKPDFSKLGFGKFFTDYMLTMEYNDGKWSEPVIEPYHDFNLDPATSCLHYAQGIFEGAKAYKSADGAIRTFRIDENFKRMNKSAERMCMPTFDEKIVKDGLCELIKLEEAWIPTAEGTALYIRPTMIGTDPFLGVHASTKYIFYIILSPVGAYYANGLKPTKIIVEDKYVRASIGGTGEAKCMGNYAASLLAGALAGKKGYDQVLWLDGAEHKYVEEVGAMNMFFVVDDEVVTPELVGSILPGITRKSSIQILKDAGYKVSERRVSIDEIHTAYKEGRLRESFGTGTAAVVSPVGIINHKGEDMIINNQEMGEITTFLYGKLTGIQSGKVADTYGWMTTIKD